MFIIASLWLKNKKNNDIVSHNDLKPIMYVYEQKFTGSLIVKVYFLNWLWQMELCKLYFFKGESLWNILQTKIK